MAHGGEKEVLRLIIRSVDDAGVNKVRDGTSATIDEGRAFSGVRATALLTLCESGSVASARRNGSGRLILRVALSSGTVGIQGR